MKDKLLLHTCCGPCFVGVWEDLGSLNFDVTSFFYNPNIWPSDEHQKRIANLEKALEGKSIELIIKDYQPEEYDRATKGKSLILPKRCSSCYLLRLEKTAQYAKENGYDAFSTTLLISPYQQHDEIKAMGETLARKHGIDFFYSDWRPHFRKSQDIARELELYRQKYCGCIFSKNGT